MNPQDQTIAWQAIATISALFVVVASGIAVYTKLTVGHALAEFKNQLLDSLNGRYAPKAVADVRFGEFERRLEIVERAEHECKRGEEFREIRERLDVMTG